MIKHFMMDDYRTFAVYIGFIVNVVGLLILSNYY